MRETLVKIKDWLKAFYGKFDVVIDTIVKFAIAFASFKVMSSKLGYLNIFENPFVMLILSLVCCILPYGLETVFIAVVLLAHVYKASMEAAIMLAMLLLVVALLYYSFHVGDAIVLVLTPLLFALKIPYVIPLILGLSGSFISVVPVSCGIIIYYLVSFVKGSPAMFDTTDVSLTDMPGRFMNILDNIIKNKEMWMVIVIFAVALIVIYLIHLFPFEYSWYVAVGVGGLIMIVMSVMLKVDFSIVMIIVSMLIAAVYVLFRFDVDYKKTDRLQFEDDDYYYYVKAIPKVSAKLFEDGTGEKSGVKSSGSRGKSYNDGK